MCTRDILKQLIQGKVTERNIVKLATYSAIDILKQFIQEKVTERNIFKLATYSAIKHIIHK